MFDLVIIGELSVNLLLEEAPALDRMGDLEVEDGELRVGGGAAAFACTAAALGLNTSFLGKIGTDPFSRFLLQDLTRRGIDTRGIRIDPKAKIKRQILFPSGSNLVVAGVIGKGAPVGPKELDRSLLTQTRHLHLAGRSVVFSLRSQIAGLFQEAHRLGLSTSISLRRERAELWQNEIMELLPRIDLLLPDAAGLMALTHTQDLGAALSNLCPNLRSFAIDLGPTGGLACRDAQQVTTPSPRPANTFAKNAADHFDAGFIYGWLAGWDVRRSLRMGCACAALAAVQGDTYPTLSETFTLLAPAPPE